MGTEADAFGYDDYTPHEPVRGRELSGAMATEARLIRKLTRCVLDQRDAIASNVVEDIEGSVFALQRVLQTLAQAKRNRRSLLEILNWHGVGLERLHEVAGRHFTAEMREARDDLLASVAELRHELLLNSEILRTVMAGGEAFLRALAGPQTAGGYGSDGVEAREGQGPLIMNRLV